MANFKIYPLHLGTLIRKEKMPIVAFYLTDGQHRVLVDTGGIPADGVSMMPYFQEPDQTLEAQLAALDVDPASIDTVLISHMHWDHMSNNHLFPNAKIYVQRAEYLYPAHSCQPAKTEARFFP